MYMLTAALVVVGWLAVLIALRQLLKRTCAELRLEFRRQIDSLAAKVKDLEEAAGARTAAVASGKREPSAATSAAQAPVPATQASDEITAGNLGDDH